MARLSAKEKALLYSNLEKYARSGMGMERACLSLLDQPRLPRTERQLYRGLLEGIRGGRSIGDALGAASPTVSSLEHEVIVAAESGGRLEKGFGHLAEYFRRMDRTRRRILKGLAYPLLLVHLAIPISTLAAAAFRSFSFGGDAPVAASPYRDALESSGWNLLLAWGVILLVLGIGWSLSRLGRTSPAIDTLLRRVPLLGKARTAIAMERFAQVFEIFLLAGRTMSDSLDGAARAAGSGLIRAAGRRGVGIVAGGEALATALRSARRAFPGDFLRGLAVAEESGQLDGELAQWGRFYAEAAAEAMEQLGEWTPKLIYWGILLFVAWLIVRAALAYRDLIQGLIDWSG